MKIKAGIEYPLNYCLDREKLQLQYSRIYQDEEETLTQQISVSKKYSRKYFVYETDELELRRVMDFTLQKDVPRSGLVAEHPFFEGSGTTCKDLSDNDNDVTLYGGVTWKQLPTGKWVLEFDGSSGYGEIASPSGLDIYGRISVSAWIKSETTGVYQEIIDRSNAAIITNGFRFDISTMDFLRLGIGYGTGRVFEEEKISPYEWHHVVGTWDGETIFVYIDGEKSTGKGFDGEISYTNVDVLRIGCHSKVLSSFFKGYIVMPRIYNAVLDQNTIKTIYNFERPIFQG
jgi:hypothetical protein